jgi:UDP-N-acetylmuramoyl-tripeptide--D-alanyl-D-alanine ligase
MVVTDADTIARVTGGEVVAGDGSAMAGSAVIDSREATAGAAFFALPGDRADGHSYIEQALQAGARVVVVARDDVDVRAAFDRAGRPDSALVHVDDVSAALSALARYDRGRLTCPVIGITGSTGKTTTKDFIFSALTLALDVVATEGNRNNELGVPLTLLRADLTTDAVVVEMGMRGEGQIRELCALARPTAGIVTNIGTSHLELLGTQEHIAHAKGELIECLPSDGRAFLNADDEWSARLAATSTAPVTYYGVGPDADVRGTDVDTDERGRVSFMLRTPEGDAPAKLVTPGRHNVYNATAAAAVGLYLGLTLSQVVEGLECATGSPMRMEVFETADGITVVNDAYNANPTSMRAALATLSDMAAQRRVAVLGDMAELGSLAELAHFKLGEAVGDARLDGLVTVGALARRIAEGARGQGMAPDRVVAVDSADEAVEAASEMLVAGDVVLVKASRVMGLEKVVEGLTST